MDSYTAFAQVYDELMDATPYQEWCQRIIAYIEKYGVSRPTFGRNPSAPATTEEALESERNLVLDLGCGTGTLTELMAMQGYDMIGIDLSEEMLLLAMDKKERSGLDIRYFCQDMRELDMYSTIGTIYCVCDSLNYLLSGEDLLQCFSQVDMFLYPGGLFLFDFNTVYKYEQVIGDMTIAENRENCSFIWENYYDPETFLNEYDLTIFVRDEGERFYRHEETHVQRGYTLEEMKHYLALAGLEFVEAIDADTGEAPCDTTERIFVAARECKKTEWT